MYFNVLYADLHVVESLHTHTVSQPDPVMSSRQSQGLAVCDYATQAVLLTYIVRHRYLTLL